MRAVSSANRNRYSIKRVPSGSGVMGENSWLLRREASATGLPGPLAEIDDELQYDDRAYHDERVVNSVVDLVEVLAVARLIERGILERKVDMAWSQRAE